MKDKMISLKDFVEGNKLKSGRSGFSDNGMNKRE
jgi:hypothetical protein